MKIKNIKVRAEDLGLTRPYSIAYKTVDAVTVAVVEIELENGIIGIGASNPSQKVVGESVEDTIRHLREADFDFLVGADIRHLEKLVIETQTRFYQWPGTQAAIDIALYDTWGRYSGVALVDYFGQKHKEMATSVTIGIKNVYETVEEATEYQQMGFRIVKIKTGLNPNEDAERVIKVNEKFPELIIRVDANQGYSPSDLISFTTLVNKVSLDLIEQPFPVAEFAKGSQGLPEQVSKYLVADESLKNASDAIFLLKNVPQCKIFNIKLMKSGGITGAREIALIAKLAEAKLMWGCNDESAISIAAALHLAFSQSHTAFIDLDGSFDLKRDIVTGGFTVKEGFMRPVLKPGLGLEL